MLACLAVFVASGARTQPRATVEIVPLVPHASEIRTVAFSPDGTLVLSGSDDRTMKLWETATGRLLRTFDEHQEAPVSVMFSPDGGRALSAGHTTVKLWEVATGRLLRSFDGHTHWVNSAAFSPDGSQVLSGSTDKTIKLWEAATGRLLRTFEDGSDGVSSVAFSPDGSRVLSGSGNSVKLWNAAAGQLLRTFEGHTNAVRAVAFAPDGRRIVSGSWDNTARLWDAVSGKLLRTFEGHSKWVTSVAFSPDGERVLTGSTDETIVLWDLQTGRVLRTFEGHTEGVTSVAFSPDGSSILSGSGDTTVRLWDTSTGRLLRNFTRPGNLVNSVAVSPDGSHMLSGSADTSVKLWDLASGRLSRRFDGHSGAINAVAFSPNGILALSGSEDKTMRLWEVSTGRLQRTFSGHTDEVNSVAFSRDGRRVLSGSEDTTVRMWDVSTGKLLHTFLARPGNVSSVAFSPDGNLVLAGTRFPDSSMGEVKLWQSSNRKLLRTFGRHSWVSSVAFSPDAKRVVTGHVEGNTEIRLFQTATGRLLRSFEGHSGGVGAVTFSPDGARVLSGSYNNQVKVWDAATGKLLNSLKGHSGEISSVAFSSDNTRIVSGSSDTSIKIWDSPRAQLLATLLAVEDGDWLSITPAGFFSGSSIGKEASLDRLSVVHGTRAYSIGQMYQSLYNPDFVRESLAGDPDGEMQAAADVLDLAKVLDSGREPGVVLALPAVAGASDREVVTAQARVTDQGGGIGRIEWRVNGATVGVVGSASGSGKERTIEQPLALEPGENTVEVLAYNGRNLLASLPASTTVTWDAPANQPRPKLFVIAIGINAYDDRVFPRLSHAVADAKAFGAAMKAAGEGLYADVDVTYVLDHEATAARLDRVIDEVGARMHPRDVFIFLAAAHGKSENGRFHLIPQDYRSQPGRALVEGAIGQDQLQDWFANRMKARRGLILLDTCESGAVVASRASGIDLGNSEAALGRLNEATGRPVLTAAAANRAALEGYQGHGVFTYAVLDALVNGDSDNNGRIELSELAAHIQTLAPRLSRELSSRGRAIGQNLPRSAIAQLGGASIAPRYAARGFVAIPSKDSGSSGAPNSIPGYGQKPRMGSRGEDFSLVKRLQSLPLASAPR